VGKTRRNEKGIVKHKFKSNKKKRKEEKLKGKRA